MSAEERIELTNCMAEMASGDIDAFFRFREQWGARVAGVVKGMARSMGRSDVVSDPDELDGLVTDACLVLRDRAAGWSPDGALPWTWARSALWAEVYRFVGHRQVELLDEVAMAPSGAGWYVGQSPSSSRSAGRNSSSASSNSISDSVVDIRDDSFVAHTDDLDDLASGHNDVQLVLAAISSTGSERDQKVFLEYRLQTGLGDPSPSNTVAEVMQLSPANVRQISKRFFGKLSTVLDQPQYADVRSAAIFAG